MGGGGSTAGSRLEDSRSRIGGQRVEYKDGKFTLSGIPLTITYSRRGVYIGCHFMTYEALDKIYKDSQE